MQEISKKTNKELGARVTKARKAHKKTQQWLAEQLGVAPNYISMIETGNRRLTEKNAEKIAKLFPPFRVQWFIGWDDFATEDEKIENERLRSQRGGIMEQEIWKKIAQRAGYEFNYREIPIDEFLHGGEAYILSDSSGEKIGLNMSEYMEFWNDFMDYAAFRLQRVFKMKSNRNKVKIDFGDEQKEDAQNG